MGLVKQVYNKIGELAKNDSHFSFWVPKAAWFASQSKGNRQGNDYYWYAAIAFFTVNLLAERDPDGRTVQELSSSLDVSNFRTRDQIFEMDIEDANILRLGFDYCSYCSIDAPVPLWWASRRSKVGLKDYYAEEIVIR